MRRRPIAAGAVVLVLAGCGSAAARTASPASPAASPAACVQQMRAWLGAEAYSAPASNPLNNQDVISDVVRLADSYLKNASDPGGSVATQTIMSQGYLDLLGDDASELGPNVPACADPDQAVSGLAGSFESDATSCGEDTPETAQAATDCEAVLVDLADVNQELTLTAPGVQIAGGT